MNTIDKFSNCIKNCESINNCKLCSLYFQELLSQVNLLDLLDHLVEQNNILLLNYAFGAAKQNIPPDTINYWINNNFELFNKVIKYFCFDKNQIENFINKIIKNCPLVTNIKINDGTLTIQINSSLIGITGYSLNEIKYSPWKMFSSKKIFFDYLSIILKFKQYQYSTKICTKDNIVFPIQCFARKIESNHIVIAVKPNYSRLFTKRICKRINHYN